MGRKGIKNVEEMYELMLVLDPSLLEKERKEIISKWRDYLTKSQAVIKEEFEGGLKDFAYKINNKFKGYYFAFYFEATGDILKDLNDKLRIEKEVFRFLITVLKKDFSLEKRELAETRILNSFAYDLAKKEKESLDMVDDDDDVVNNKKVEKEDEIKEKGIEKKIEKIEKIEKNGKVVEKRVELEDLDSKIDDLIDNI